MNFNEFKRERAEFLQERLFEKARTLERHYLAEHPGDVQALWMSAWTSNALGDPAENKMLLSMAAHAFWCGQRALRDHIATRNARILRDIAGDRKELSNRTPALTPSLLVDHVIDEIWGWAQFVPVKVGDGQVADIGAFGRYLVKDHTTVLEKRLCRCIPWEASLTVFLIDYARIMPCGSAIVDVGANIGATAIPVALKHNGPVFGFEPLPGNHVHLEKNAALNDIDNLSISQMAVGATDGEIRIAEGPTNNPGMAHIAPDGETGTLVEMISLDTAFAAERVGLIKIDVEGYEFAVLDGARAVISRDQPVIVLELLGGEQSKAARDFLTGQGYTSQRLSRNDHVFYVP